MIELVMRVMVRPTFPEKREIVLKADVTNVGLDMNKLTELAFQIEYVLNEHIPQIRVHSALNVITPNE